jgi:Glyoxalase-like domain
VAGWGLTLDCADPAALARFWCLALGYVPASPPAGWSSWEAWFDRYDVPVEERDDGAFVVDPAGVLPSLSFLRVPESKSVKNRVHVDVGASGGREVPQDDRLRRIEGVVSRLVEAGGVVLRRDEIAGVLDHVVMQDPEANEFCVV